MRGSGTMPRKRHKRKEVERSSFSRLQDWRNKGFVAAMYAVNFTVWGALAWAFPLYALAVISGLTFACFVMFWLCRDVSIHGELLD